MNTIWPAVSALALLHGRRISARDLAAYTADVPLDILPEAVAVSLQRYGFETSVFHVNDLQEVSQLPVLLRLKNNQWCLWIKEDSDQVSVRSFSNIDDNQIENWPLSRLQDEFDGLIITTRSSIHFDAQTQEDTLRTGAHWFWDVFLKLRSYYADSVVATILINLLALAGSMFSMNVYDRIIPNGAFHSLWVLAIGVFIAALFELGFRSLRADVVDNAGKRADLALSAQIFRKSLNLKPEDRPASSGQFAGQIREFESVREFVSSSTLVALTDLPFALLFMAVIGYISGQLVWIPVISGVLILLIGIISQWPIRESIHCYQYENTQKLAFLVEALERLETIEALGAHSSIQGRWERLSAISARSSMSSRAISTFSINLTQFVQQFANTALIVGGVYLILQGDLTTGALIGCTILSGRALAPLGQVTALMARWQHTRVAYQALDRLMSLPERNNPHQTYLALAKVKVDLTLKSVRFSYPRSESCVLSIDHLKLNLGQVVAVMGPVGSGKSTLLKLLAGLNFLSEGQLLVDGLNLSQISPADWRSQVAWVGQDAVLFRGSLRENILIASPNVSDERFVSVLKLCGLETLLAAHPLGLDMPLGDAGQGLSGGQRQMVALARALLSDAKIILLDEPTSAFDMMGEAVMLQRLKSEFEGRLVVIATHRPGPLELASRLIILDHGQITADGSRDAVLQAVKAGNVKRPSQQFSHQIPQPVML